MSGSTLIAGIDGLILIRTGLAGFASRASRLRRQSPARPPHESQGVHALAGVVPVCGLGTGDLREQACALAMPNHPGRYVRGTRGSSDVHQRHGTSRTHATHCACIEVGGVLTVDTSGPPRPIAHAIDADQKDGLTLPRWEGREWSTVRTRSQEHTMIAFEVNDMTCGHCVGAINKALKALTRRSRSTSISAGIWCRSGPNTPMPRHSAMRSTMPATHRCLPLRRLAWPGQPQRRAAAAAADESRRGPLKLACDFHHFVRRLT